MLENNFSTTLTVNRFTRHNEVNTGRFDETALFFDPKAQRLPMICQGIENHKKVGTIVYTEAVQFYGRTITKARMGELMDMVPYPILIIYLGKSYLVGKGFLAEYDIDNGTVSPLFVVMAPNRGTWTADELEGIVNKKVYTSDYRNVQVLVQPFIDAIKGDVIVTTDMTRHVAERIIIPSVKSLSARKFFVDNLLENSLSMIRRGV